MAEPEEAATERDSLCLPDFSHGDGHILHAGDPGFQNVMNTYYPSLESSAIERLVKLKAFLRPLETKQFWTLMMKDMCDILGAQCGLVAKRILVDDENSAIEMPELGEPGSCLMGVAFYLNDDAKVEKMHHDYRYHAYGSPCAHMRHDKVFVIPERLAYVVPNSPNKLPWERSEAFIGIPLFADGKCFAHYAVIWSEEGAATRPKLSWGFIEMFLYSLEDMILERLLSGQGFAKDPVQQPNAPCRVIPLDAITASQSLKPYARSLSHELRTPMQGVVGMLDIMHSTILEAMETQTSESRLAVFGELKANIEVVQESSKRAVEAATNVVHAYDLNLQMPETSLETCEADMNEDGFNKLIFDTPVDERGRPVEEPWPSSSKKRHRSEEAEMSPGSAFKRLALPMEKELPRAFRPAMMRSARGTSEPLGLYLEKPQADDGYLVQELSHKSECGSPRLAPAIMSPTRKSIVTREFFDQFVKESLKSVNSIGKSSARTELGEAIAVTRRGPRGEVRDLTINLVVDADVPETILISEQHLQFALQKVFDNAIKFTETGYININLKLVRGILDIHIRDTGCGMSEESKAHLFKPHFQEDASIRRSRDGLGLSLFNAKAHVRKNLGGDMILERSATTGPLKGSEFLIRVPLSPFIEISRASTPRVGTPVPDFPHSTPPQTPRSIPHVRPITPTPTLILEAPFIPTIPSITPIKPLLPSLYATNKRPKFNSSLATHIPLTILIAEDNIINRQILVAHLRKLGYPQSSIHVAFDGLEAVSKYKRSLYDPDRRKRINVVLMDLWMPNMDGYEATERILALDREFRSLNVDRRRERRSESSASEDGDVDMDTGTDGSATGQEQRPCINTNNNEEEEDSDDEMVKIMAVTADVTSESLERARRTGMTGFICKPYKVLDVERLIVQHFRGA